MRLACCWHREQAGAPPRCPAASRRPPVAQEGAVHEVHRRARLPLRPSSAGGFRRVPAGFGTVTAELGAQAQPQQPINPAGTPTKGAHMELVAASTLSPAPGAECLLRPPSTLRNLCIGRGKRATGPSFSVLLHCRAEGRALCCWAPESKLDHLLRGGSRGPGSTSAARCYCSDCASPFTAMLN